jgi:hypothetical protein
MNISKKEAEEAMTAYFQRKGIEEQESLDLEQLTELKKEFADQNINTGLSGDRSNDAMSFNH